MARPSKNAWMAELLPGQSTVIPETSANRMAVSYWKRRTGFDLRTRTLPDGQMLVERLDRTTITMPIASLTPRACEVLADEFHAGEEDALAALFGDLYAELTGEALSLPATAETDASQ